MLPSEDVAPCREQLKVSYSSWTLAHLQALCVVRASGLQHAPEQRHFALEADQVVVPALALESLLLKQNLLHSGCKRQLSESRGDGTKQRRLRSLRRLRPRHTFARPTLMCIPSASPVVCARTTSTGPSSTWHVLPCFSSAGNSSAPDHVRRTPYLCPATAIHVPSDIFATMSHAPCVSSLNPLCDITPLSFIVFWCHRQLWQRQWPPQVAVQQMSALAFAVQRK